MGRFLRLIGTLGVVAASVYVVISGIEQGRTVEAVVYVLLISPLAMVLACMLSEACAIPGICWKCFRRRVVRSGSDAPERQVQEG